MSMDQERTRLYGLMTCYLGVMVAVLLSARALLAPHLGYESNELAFGLTCLAVAVTTKPICRRLLRVLPAPRGGQVDARVVHAVPVDDIGEDVDLGIAIEASRRGDWQPAAALLSASRNVDVRAERLVALAQAAVTDSQWVEEWLAARPADALVAVVRAEVAVERAWASRGGHRAEHTSADQFRSFHTGLTVAERLAERAIELAPDDPAPWVALVTLARGQAVPREEFERRVHGMFARAPHHVMGSHSALQAVCAKWLGSTEVMFDVARGLAAEAPTGSAVCLLPVQAHVEHHLELLRGVDGDYHAARHMKAAETRNELRSCVQRWLAGPEGGPMPGRQRHGHNLAAYAFWLAKDREAARPHLEAIGRSVTGSPWVYTDAPGYVLGQARAWAGLPELVPATSGRGLRRPRAAFSPG